jgi:signal transduction histidine kinase
MNHDVERFSNAVLDETRLAGRSLPPVTGGSERSFLGREEERREQELHAEEPGRRPSESLSNGSLIRLLNRMHRVIGEGRMVLQGLRAPLTPSTWLEHALSELWDEIAPAAGPQFRIVTTGQPKTLRSAIQDQIYLIGREAVVNALRHSEATNIEAEVEYFPRRLHVVVRDNGRGIERKVLTARKSDRGLHGMLERARAMGARLEIWSRPGSGTEVELSLPFDSRSMPALNP